MNMKITMKIGEKQKEKTERALEYLKAEYELGTYPHGNLHITVSEMQKDVGADAYELKRVFNNFENSGLINSAVFIDGNEAVYEEEYDYDVFIVDFANDFLAKYTQFIQSYCNKLDDDGQVKTLLNLDNDGNLWREPKNTYCYSMEINSERFKLVKYLVDIADNTEEEYEQTPYLADKLNYENEQTVRGTVKKINEKTKNFLEVNKLIQGKKGMGYRINPKYKIQKY